jgi:hypothetical protein
MQERAKGFHRNGRIAVMLLDKLLGILCQKLRRIDTFPLNAGAER